LIFGINAGVALPALVGEHDFYSFARRETNISSTVRTVLDCEILQGKSLLSFGNENLLFLGLRECFLKQMVRYIAPHYFHLGRTK